MITTRPHEKLIAWQEAFRLSLAIYKHTTAFPQEERYCLVRQLRRAALSIPLNIAEGNARRSKKEKRHFLHIALGSLEELHCQCRIARSLDYIDQTTFTTIDDHINRVSYLINKLQYSFHPTRTSS